MTTFAHEIGNILFIVDCIEALKPTSMLMSMQEMFELYGRAIDSEAEHIVPLLAKKAGEVSVAGRENFMASEADAALAAMVENLSEPRVSVLQQLENTMAVCMMTAGSHMFSHAISKLLPIP